LKNSAIPLTFDFELNGKILTTKLEVKRKQIEDKVNSYNQSNPSNEKLSEFIHECKNILDSSSLILRNSILSNNLLGKSDRKIIYRTDFEKTRFKLPIDKIFDTGHNVILLGEAGAGKTTCLQMYALSKEKDIKKLYVWAPLANILQNWSKNEFQIEDSQEKVDETKIEQFNTAIFEYLISKNIALSLEEFNHLFDTKKSTLLLDGIDEAIKSNPWLPKAIIKLSHQYTKAQIIVTSRISGQYINELPFFTTTLLPFTDSQRNEFIEKWFAKDKSDIVDTIKNHLSKNESISKITRNPLLTTTLCVLARYKLPLPQTEVKLYNDRLKLLSGYYDNVKNIEIRITTTPQNLEFLAQKLAYFLHSKGVREMDKTILENKSVVIMENYLNEKDSKQAFNELIDPCNIIIPMTTDGKYGFGHLRYQEHLAALELKTNRSIDIERLLSNVWWRDTLMLFSQMSESIEWLVSKVGYKIEIPEYKKTISEMLKLRPNVEQKAIQKIINILLKEKSEYFDLIDESYN